MTANACLALEDGSIFPGDSFGAELEAAGEVVFTTSMTGYQEVITDPSFAGQIVTMTCPHIGNVGVNPEDMESGALDQGIRFSVRRGENAAHDAAAAQPAGEGPGVHAGQGGNAALSQEVRKRAA
jgi:carbamoylphosphate synthase small subunit